MTPEAEALCLAIDAAFTSATRELDGAGRVVQPAWRNMPSDELKAIDSELAFLTPDQYRHYLPALMVFSVVDFEDANPIPQDVVHSLTLPDTGDLDEARRLSEIDPQLQPLSSSEWEEALSALGHAHESGMLTGHFYERVLGFTAAQAAAIVGFLEHMRDAHGGDFPRGEPQLAIDRYWRAAASRPGHRGGV